MTERSLYITPWSRALLEKPPVVQLLKELPEYYRTRQFITIKKKELATRPNPEPDESRL
jgi:hypothetical protein